MAAISFLTSLINVPAQYSGILGVLILVGILLVTFVWQCLWNIFLQAFLGFSPSGYEVWLMQGLNMYLLSNERGRDIISQNKEGLFSIFGKRS